MASILISVMPFAGHLNPISGVVSALLADGHDVAVHTGSRYVERVRSLGARAIPWQAAADFDEHDLPATFPQVGRRGPRGLLANVEHVFIGTGSGQARDVIAAHSATPFDIIVGDVMSVGAGLAAEMSGLPWATLSITPLSMPSRDLPPSALALHPGHGRLGRVRDWILRRAVAAATVPLDRAMRVERRAVGLPPGRPFAHALYSPDLVIVTGSPLLDYPRSDLGDRFEYVGRLAPATSGHPVPPSWRDEVVGSGRRVVLVTQGTFNVDPRDLVQPTLEALADRDVLVLATTAGAQLAGPVPTNARLADRLDFDDLLPHVDLMITNGGWGGVLEALSRGIPLVVAGGDLDKPDIAARVAWSGAGVNLRTGRPSPRAIGRAYDRITADPAFARAAQRIGQDMSLRGGAARAAELIAGLAR